MLVVELVDLRASLLLGSDEAEISEYAKLLGHRRLLHVGLGRQLLDRDGLVGVLVCSLSGVVASSTSVGASPKAQVLYVGTFDGIGSRGSSAEENVSGCRAASEMSRYRLRT